MARRTTTIDLKPWDPEYFLTLCETLLERNTSLGASSPFAGGEFVDMTEYASLATRARQKRNEALEHYAIAVAAMYESRSLIGTIKGQTVITPGTLLHLTTKAKQTLLVLNTDNPEELSAWGFDVVVKVAKNRGRKKKA